MIGVNALPDAHPLREGGRGETESRWKVGSGPAPDPATRRDEWRREYYRRNKKRLYEKKRDYARKYFQQNKQRIYAEQKERRELHKSLGICVQCKQPIDPRSTNRCTRHLELNREHVRKSQQRRGR